MEDKIVETSRGRVALYLLASLAFAIMPLAFQRSLDDADWRLWLCATFFGFCALIFLVILIRPFRLVLDPVGFQLQGGFRRSGKRIAWSDIDEFFVWHLPKGGRSVGYRYRPDAKNIPRMVSVSRALGADGALPRAWPIGPEELAAELNAYRAWATRQTPLS